MNAFLYRAKRFFAYFTLFFALVFLVAHFVGTSKYSSVDTTLDPGPAAIEAAVIGLIAGIWHALKD
jgi:uncharacterized membrane-anchored protein YjiN (DUF445 family)